MVKPRRILLQTPLHVAEFLAAHAAAAAAEKVAIANRRGELLAEAVDDEQHADKELPQ